MLARSTLWSEESASAPIAGHKLLFPGLVSEIGGKVSPLAHVLICFINEERDSEGARAIQDQIPLYKLGELLCVHCFIEPW